MSELTPRAAEIRLAQYGEPGKPYDCGNEKALHEIALTFLAEIDRLRAELEKYVGKEPTVVEEMAYLNRCLNAVYDLCGEAKRKGITSGGMFTVAAVEQAADGERADNPNDKRRRLYVDGKGNAWIDCATDENGVRYVIEVDEASGEEQPLDAIAERTGSLREIGRCW